MLTARGNCIRWASGVALLCAVGGTATAALAGVVACQGDCNGDGMVAINELVLVVNIELGSAQLSACPGYSCDGKFTNPIACVMDSVNHALLGCPAPSVTTAGIVFNGEGNRLHAYQPTSPEFPKQTVVPSNADLPGGAGRDLNAQICFTRGPEGQVRFIGGEDTNQGPVHSSAGWGFFELTGTEVGQFQFQEIGKLIPTYQQTADEAENYGCGFLSDGRLLTTDVGNQASGLGNGQLIIWFPPLDNGANYTETGVFPTTPAKYCKLDIAIGTAQQIAIDGQDRVYVGSSRANGAGAGAGVYRYTGPFPTSDTPEGGCDGTDDTGAPMATHVTKEHFIPGDGNIPTPAGVVIKPDGNFYVSSVLNGVIAEYDADGHFVRKVLRPSGPGLPIPSGTPLGIGLASDGTIYYADIGLVIGPGGIGPGNNTGTVRRIRFVDGQPQPPETMDTGLDFPDGIGVLELPLPTSTPDCEECSRTRKPTAITAPTRTPVPTP